MLQDVSIPVENGTTRPGVLSLPETGAGPHPGVVIIHDIYGFRRDTRRHCRRFAEAGYAAIAPNLYGGGRPGCVVETLRALASEGTPPAVAAARQFLADRPEVDPARIGITGFCMGGGFALLAAADDTYAVAAPFYGTVPKSKERIAGVCPTLAQYGERDIPFRSHAARLSRYLEELGVPHEVLTHPGVGHSFMNNHGALADTVGRLNPLRAAYDAPTEAVAWEKLLAFFEAHMPKASAPVAP